MEVRLDVVRVKVERKLPKQLMDHYWVEIVESTIEKAKEIREWGNMLRIKAVDETIKDEGIGFLT